MPQSAAAAVAATLYVFSAAPRQTRVTTVYHS